MPMGILTLISSVIVLCNEARPDMGPEISIERMGCGLDGVASTKSNVNLNSSTIRRNCPVTATVAPNFLPASSGVNTFFFLTTSAGTTQ